MVDANQNLQFGIALYQEISRKAPAENVFISPTSVALALAMTRSGASGGTSEAMAKTLGLEGLSAAAANAADSFLIARLNAPVKGVELSIANSLWGRKGTPFKESFLEANKRFYGAEVRSIDFSSPASPTLINRWVDEKTRGKITEIVGEIDPAAFLFLVNAIYFKGTWEAAFDKAATREEPFHIAGGGETKCMLMQRTDDFSYLAGDGFQAAALPYGDGKIEMIVFLPDEGSSLGELQKRLTAESWASWTERLSTRKGTVALPRFRVEFKKSLKPVLQSLGMAVAFDPERADFSAMLELGARNAFIQDVLHKTFVEVNEEGTEAAAVTSVEMRLTSVAAPIEQPFRMICDRPFLYAIRDRERGTILFIGSLVKPS